MGNHPTGLLCMWCGKEANDASEEGPERNSMWVYCKPCDTWTEHPYRDEPTNPVPQEDAK